ncbi:MAG: hypothetical protein ACQESR_02430 [Planctomycetota bacterium]
MMNHMVRQVAPRIRSTERVDRYFEDLDNRPSAQRSSSATGHEPPGFPQKMQGMSMSSEFMQKIWNRREVQGIRANWPLSVHGLMTSFRVLPEDLYHQVIETDADIPRGAIFDGIVRRFGNPATYEPAAEDMASGDY